MRIYLKAFWTLAKKTEAKKQVTNEGLKKQEEESSSQDSDNKQEQDMEEEIPEDKKKEKNKNKRKTEHFLDNSDDESQKKVKFL